MAQKLICIVVLPCLVLCGCFLRQDTGEVNFPETETVSRSVLWAVISDPYVSFRDTPGEAGIITAHGRRGDILKIAGRVILTENGKNSIWYQFEKGWLPETAVFAVSNRLKAETAAKDME